MTSRSFRARKANSNRSDQKSAGETRLMEGRCPVHGFGLSQIGVWHRGNDGGYVVACPRKDCFRSWDEVDVDGVVRYYERSLVADSVIC